MRSAFGYLLGLLLAFCLFVAGPATAVEVPPLRGHVVDTSGKLSAEDVAYLDAALERDRSELGVPIVAFVVGDLAGEPIEDVAYTAFNAWGIGDAERDDGVLLVIAPEERRVRIETGKGIGDRLTDLESSDIIERVVGPLLAEGRFRSAIEQGSRAIAEAASDGSAAPVPAPATSIWTYLGLAALLIAILALAIVSPTFRGLLFFGFLFGGNRFGGGGRGAGSGFSGGGGSSGGGGASGSY